MLQLILLKVILFVLLASPVVADEVNEPLSWDIFSKKVLAYYPVLKSAHSDVDIALAQQMKARSGFWPSLDLSAGYKISDDPVNVFGMLLRQERFTSSDFDLKRLNTPDRHQDLSAGVHMEWPLFDAMQTIGRVRSAREGVKATQAEEAFLRMEALLIAQDAYLNALTLDKLQAVIEGVQKDSEQDLNKAKDLKDKGMVLGADYYSARVIFAEFTRMKNEIGHQRKAMDALLNILMGESSDKAWIFTDTIKESHASVDDRQALMAVAMASRLDLASLQARLKAFDAELSREKAGILPSISLFADATNNRNKIASDGGDNYTVGLKGKVALVDPGRPARIKETKAMKEKLEQGILSLKDSIRRDIVQESARSDALRDNMAILKGMTDDAREAVMLVVPLYSEGRKSIADLLEVRRAYLSSAQSYSRALAGLCLSQARLLFLTGQLDDGRMKMLLEGAGL